MKQRMSPTIKAILDAPDFKSACRVADNNKVHPETLIRWWMHFATRSARTSHLMYDVLYRNWHYRDETE